MDSSLTKDVLVKELAEVLHVLDQPLDSELTVSHWVCFSCCLQGKRTAGGACGCVIQGPTCIYVRELTVNDATASIHKQTETALKGSSRAIWWITFSL